MKKINFKLYSQINKKYRKYLLGFIVIIFIISAVLCFLAIRQPLQIEEKIITNNIEEITSFDYKAVVKPSTLYPNGGVVTPDKVIFNSLTEDFIVNIKSDINTDKPVKIEAIKEIKYSIVAEKMWEREFTLVDQKQINIEGDSSNLLNNEVHLNLPEINNYITKVEEETLVRPNYLLVIKPKITGKIFDENNNIIYEINNLLEIPFSLSGQYISYAGETEEKEFINTKIIEETNIKPQYFNIFGMNLYVVASRLGFGITALISLILIVLYFKEVNSNKRTGTTEISIIDKKNKSKIVTVSNKIDLQNNSYINIKSFKDLLKIAEEKDETILKYEDCTLGIIYYYITGTSFIYLFKCIIDIKGSEQVQDA